MKKLKLNILFSLLLTTAATGIFGCSASLSGETRALPSDSSGKPAELKKKSLRFL